MLIFLVIVAFSAVGGYVASLKNRNIFLWALICGCAPVVGFIVLALLPTLPSKAASAVVSKYTPSPVVVRPAPLELAPSYDKKKWDVLLNVDPDLASAAGKVRAVDPSFLEEFAETYMTVNDKTYLPAITDKVLEKANAAVQNRIEQRARLGEEQAKLLEKRDKFKEQRLQFARTEMNAIASRNNFDARSERPVAQMSLYDGNMSDGTGGLKIIFGDGRIELRQSEDMRIFFTDEEDFVSRDHRI